MIHTVAVVVTTVANIILILLSLQMPMLLLFSLLPVWSHCFVESLLLVILLGLVEHEGVGWGPDADIKHAEMTSLLLRGQGGGGGT